MKLLTSKDMAIRSHPDLYLSEVFRSSFARSTLSIHFGKKTRSRMETWALVLLVLASVLVGGLVLMRAVKAWAAAAYRRILNTPATQCDIDAFVGPHNPVNAVKCALAHKIQIGRRVAGTTPIALETTPSLHVPGLRVSRKVVAADKATNVQSLEQFLASSSNSSSSNNGKKPIVICTIRMGFGHHRLAYSVSSWALAAGHPTIFHDLLNIQSGACMRMLVC
jgi:hypothetical protein